MDDFEIRPARPEDQDALAALEAAAPEEGDVTVVVRARVPYFQLVGRPGERRGFVAVDGAGRIHGSTFLLVEDVQFNGAIRRAGYISSVRTGPAARRKGLAERLVRHAEEEARTAGSALTWAGIIGGNTASLRFFTHRMGYAHSAHLVGRTVVTWRERLRRAPRGLVVRPAKPRDIAGVVAALNRFYADWQFWHPYDPASYGPAVGQLARNGLGTLWLAESPEGRLRAAALVVDRSKLADILVQRVARWPAWLNALLRASVWRRPVRLGFTGDLLAVDGDAPALAGLLRAVAARLWPALDALAVQGDERTALGEAITRLGGPTTRLHLVWKAPEPADEWRPVILR